MVTIALVASILFTIVVLYLSMVTINKGYAYKHTIDPIEPQDEEGLEKETQKLNQK